MREKPPGGGRGGGRGTGGDRALTVPAKTRTEWFQDLATTAWHKGQTALLDGRAGEALSWLDRAHRLAPSDTAIALALASARVQSGKFGQAIELLDELAGGHDIREVWLSLATIRHRVGAAEAAAAALARALSGHALPPAAHVPALADAIAAAADSPGWCALNAARDLVVHPVPGGPAPVIWFDGDAVPGQPGVVPAGVLRVDVMVDETPLLGSPIRVEAIDRVEGIVSVTNDGEIEGWAWHPGAPERDPRLLVRAMLPGGKIGPVIGEILADDQGMVARTPLSRPRRLRVPAAMMAGKDGMFAITATDGRHLLGSPLAPFGGRRAAMAAARGLAATFSLAPSGQPAAPEPEPAEGEFTSVPADVRGIPAYAPSRPDRPIAVVVPVYGHAGLATQCLASVVRTVPEGTRVIVVDDASPDSEVTTLLDRLGSQGRVEVIRHPINRGFPGAANTGMRAALASEAPHDVVLLNSDTVVPHGWLEALRGVVHGGQDIGSATPLSNDATILSYPSASGGNSVPDQAELRRWARLAAAAHGTAAVEIPSAVGFCMYIRHECLLDVGLFREDLFAQGYGEENDFCIRARHLGWRHVAAPGVFVAHVGGQSFGGAREALIERNLAVLERVHPGYHALIAAFQAADPLAPARRAIDIRRWQSGRRAGAVLLITHASGGGVERVVRERCQAIRAAGLRAIVLRSVMTTEGVPAYRPGLCAIEDGGLPADTAGFPNLHFQLPGDNVALTRLLRGDRPERIELHHLLGHDHAVLRLAGHFDIPLDTHVHDYAAFCPRISLVGRDGRYCGEPDNLAVCEACVRDVGSNLAEPIGVRALRGRSAADLRRSRRIVVPSEDVATRMRRHFTDVAPIVEPLEDDSAYPPPQPLLNAPQRIGVIGGIGSEKGYDVLLACARNAAARRLNLHFTVIGHTHDDERLIETGHVFVTGPYKEAEAVGLIRAHDLDMAWQPSIWPETWCFTLGVAWRAGLCVAAFDLGAIAERIRRTGRGWLLPLGLPPAAINSALVGLRRAAGA